MNAFMTTRNLLLACSITLLAGCGGSSSADTTTTANTAQAATATSTASSATTGSADTSASRPLTTDEINTLLFVREEEKMARDVYLSLYGKWEQQVFENIATGSEQQHMDVMGSLISHYNLVDPVVDNTVGVFTDPQILALYQDLVMKGSFTLLDGLKVGGFIEEFDINDLQEAIDEAKAGSAPADVIQAYENLMCGSRNHLRAFVGQIEKNNVDYVAQVMPQASVDAIVSTSEEQCGQ